MRVIYLLFTLCILSAAISICRGDDSTNDDFAHHTHSVHRLEPVLGVRAEFRSDAQADAPHKGHRLRLQFEIYNRLFVEELKPFHLFSEETSVDFHHGEEAVHHSKKPEPRTFYRSDDNGWITATFSRASDTFHAVIVRFDEQEEYHLDPISIHSDALNPLFESHIRRHAVHDMVAYKTSSLLPNVTDNLLCGVTRESASATTTQSFADTKRNLLAVDRWTNCYPADDQLHTLSVGVGVDYSFYKLFNKNADLVESSVANAFAAANLVYMHQLNIKLQVSRIMINVANGGVSWNDDPARCASIETNLNRFTQWRGTDKRGEYGLWHMLTNCYPPPGAVGLAWIGTLCSDYGTGVSSYTTPLWLVVAHEIGHNFGADHSFEQGQGRTGGIMDYGDGKLYGEYQFNTKYRKTEICQQVTANMYREDPNCFFVSSDDVSPIDDHENDSEITDSFVCGNGIVELGETCDDDSICCDQTSCRLAAGAQCSINDHSPIANTACCVNCELQPTTVRCGDGGRCGNIDGTCSPTGCDDYSLPFCGVDPSHKCKEACIYANSCYNMDWTTAWRDFTIEDGTICGIDPFRVCSRGVCVYATAPRWEASEWSSCSCGSTEHIRSRAVVCTNDVNDTTVPVPSFVCDDIDHKPRSTKSCDCDKFMWSRTPLLFGFLPYAPESTSEHHECPCGYDDEQHLTYVVGCQRVSTTAPFASIAVPSSFCAMEKRPSEFDDCASCGPTWHVGDFSECSATCGPGTRSRILSCINAQGLELPVSACNEASMPTTTLQSCNLRDCNSYDWRTFLWEPCNNTTSQFRLVRCQHTSTLEFVADSFCDVDLRPESTRFCVEAGVYEWRANEWMPCNAHCGSGQTTRIVSCFDLTTNVTVDDALCADLDSLHLFQSCNTQPCKKPEWHVSEWSACSEPCGGNGLAHREVMCLDEDSVPLPASACQRGNAVAPTDVVACNEHACTSYEYNVGDWGDCPETFNCTILSESNRTRQVTCQTVGSHVSVDDTLCADLERPPSSMPCSGDCASQAPLWQLGKWSDCSSECGGGSRARTKLCTNHLGMPVPPFLCPSNVTSVEPCNTHHCPAYWFASPWSQCSSSCGVGTMVRDVSCHTQTRGITTLVDDSLCSGAKPSESSDCNIEPCPEWSTGEWGDCVPIRDGLGIQNRTVSCVDLFDSLHALDECFESGPMPPEQQGCQVDLAHWVYGEWTECSHDCMPVHQTNLSVFIIPTQTRSATCVLDSGESDKACNPDMCTQPLEVKRNCYLDPCPEYYVKTTWSESCNAPECGTSGTQTGTASCAFLSLTGTEVNTASSLCRDFGGQSQLDLLDDGAILTRNCTGKPCVPVHWRTSWNDCQYDVACDWVQSTASVCVHDGCIESIVNDSLCYDANLAKPPTESRECDVDLPSCQGSCENSQCICWPGFTGLACEQAPLVSNVQILDETLYSEAGASQYDMLEVSFSTAGQFRSVRPLLKKDSWELPVYLDTPRYVRASARRFSVTPPNELAYGDDYVIVVWYSPTVNSASTSFSIADSCSYMSCGAHGDCEAGRCMCADGWSGEFCQTTPCEMQGCSPSRGTCVPTFDAIDASLVHTCVCFEEFTGVDCSDHVDCPDLDCVHGTEIDDVVSGKCKCECPSDSFWSGVSCDTCNLQCENGGIPSDDCTTCDCPTPQYSANGDIMQSIDNGVFFTGTHCNCPYLAASFQVDLSPNLVLQSGLSQQHFLNNFERDMEFAIAETYNENESWHLDVDSIQVVVVDNSYSDDMDSIVLVHCKLLTTCPSDRRVAALAQEDASSDANIISDLVAARQQMADMLEDDKSELYRGVVTYSIIPQATRIGTVPPEEKEMQLSTIAAIAAGGTAIVLGVALCILIRSKRCRLVSDKDIASLDDIHLNPVPLEEKAQPQP